MSVVDSELGEEERQKNVMVKEGLELNSKDKIWKGREEGKPQEYQDRIKCLNLLSKSRI